MSTIEVGLVKVTRSQITDKVDVFHAFYNAGEKEIKYITFTYVPYNSVKDAVACTVSGEIEKSGKLTGPIPPKHKSFVKWENMWFNPTIESAVLTEIRIQYMDNSEEVIEGEDIVSIHDKNSIYYRDIGRKEEEERKEAAKKRKEEEERRKAAEEKRKEEQKKQNKKKRIIGWCVLGAFVIFLAYSLLSGITEYI